MNSGDPIKPWWDGKKMEPHYYGYTPTGTMRRAKLAKAFAIIRQCKQASKR